MSRQVSLKVKGIGIAMMMLFIAISKYSVNDFRVNPSVRPHPKFTESRFLSNCIQSSKLSMFGHECIFGLIRVSILENILINSF